VCAGKNDTGKNTFFDSLLPPYFCRVFAGIRRAKPKILQMEQTKKFRGVWWLVFLASTAALIFAIYSHWPWLTLILPFQTTAFVKAMNIM
jgi:hypothetical protein